MANQVLGAGKIYLQPRDLSTNALIKGERFIGNAPEFSLSVETETLDHYASTGGIRVKDKTVTLETTRTGTVTVDDINTDNVAMFFLGATGEENQAGGSITDETITVEQGYYYQLGQTATNPHGATGVSNVVVGDDPTPTVTYVEGTDYTIDLASGRLYIIEGGAIASGAAEMIYVDYDAAAVDRPLVLSGSQEFVGALRFVADNPEGLDKDYYIPYCKITPNGEYSLIGEEWQQLSFNVEVLVLDGNTEAVYVSERA